MKHAALRRAVVAALAVSTLALTAACGGDDADSSKGEGAKASGGSASPKPVEAKPLTEAQVKAALLTAKEIPGWKEDKDLSTANAGRDEFQVGTADDDAKSCQSMLDALVGGEKAPSPKTEKVLGFSKGDTGPWLMTGVLTYSEKDAKAVMGTAPVSADCNKVHGDFEGDPATFTYKETTAPKAGDESRGFRIRVDVEGSEGGYYVQYDYTYARVGANVVALTQLSIEKPETSALEKAFTAAVAKAESVTPKG
ncbi:hypothetical protein AB0M28_09210 [Streptomyces sp. NPDC051940]|uniref:hypothetical protein n=1 Tax=Streptomyces sp. NPDC051940 TaxID=3155675 RepID=UPI003432D06C